MAAIPIPGVNTPTYQTWGAAVANKLNTFTVTKVSGTTDSWGNITAGASVLGLATVTGGTVSINNNPNNQNATYFCGEVWVNGNALVWRTLYTLIAENNVENWAAGNGTWTVVAFGTVAATTTSDDEATLLPAPEEEPDDE